MTNYEAIRELSIKNMEKLLDQVFLTGLNTGHQILVDSELTDENPFNADWLKSETEVPNLVFDEAGEFIIIEPLSQIIVRMAVFNEEDIPEEIIWQPEIIIPNEGEA